MKMQSVFKTGTIQCKQNISVDYEMPAMHIHDVYEIYMAQSSGVNFLVNNCLYELECGDVMLFSNRDLHKVSVSEKSLYKRYVITFPPELFREKEQSALLTCFDDTKDQRNHRLRLTLNEQKTLIELINILQDEQRQTHFGELGQQMALGRILVFLNRIFIEQQQAPVPAQSQDMRIRKVLEYVDKNYSRHISLDELGNLCYLNKHYLCRLFKKETSFCMNDYIVYRRLSAAVMLLRKGESVSNTARISGFASDTHFITTFKKHFGTTPYRYTHHPK